LSRYYEKVEVKRSSLKEKRFASSENVVIIATEKTVLEAQNQGGKP